MSIPEAVNHLGINRAAVYFAINAGKLETIEVSGTRFLKRSSVEAYKPRNYPRRARAGEKEAAP